MSERDLVVVSPDERGFWHCDFYAEWGDEEPWRLNDVQPAPDGFATTAKGASEAEAKALAAKHWPDARIAVALPDEDNEE